MGMSGFGFALLFWLPGLAVTAVVLYWVIRLAVLHGLRDSQAGLSGPPPLHAQWQQPWPPSPQGGPPPAGPYPPRP